MTDTPLEGQALIDRLRYVKEFIDRLSKVFKCRPDELHRELKKMMDRMEQARIIMEDFKEL